MIFIKLTCSKNIIAQCLWSKLIFARSVSAMHYHFTNNCFDMDRTQHEKHKRPMEKKREHKAFIWNRRSTRNLLRALCPPPHHQNPCRKTSVHIWLLATCPCPHFQQAVWGSVAPPSLCVPSACYERQAPESCWWRLLALASGTVWSSCVPAWSGWWSSGTGALWSACGKSPSRCRLELPGWARSVWTAKRMERWPGAVLCLPVWWCRGVVWAGGPSGCHCLSLTCWSEWRHGRRRCWVSLVLPVVAALRGKAESCSQPGSPLPPCDAAPSSPHL